MKKLIALLSLALLFAFTGCGEDEAIETETPSDEVVDETPAEEIEEDSNDIESMEDLVKAIEEMYSNVYYTSEIRSEGEVMNQETWYKDPQVKMATTFGGQNAEIYLDRDTGEMDVYLPGFGQWVHFGPEEIETMREDAGGAGMDLQTMMAVLPADLLLDNEVVFQGEKAYMIEYTVESEVYTLWVNAKTMFPMMYTWEDGEYSGEMEFSEPEVGIVTDEDVTFVNAEE